MRFIDGSGPHYVDASDEVVFCDANNGGPVQVKLSTTNAPVGSVRIVRLEENGNDNASYCKVSAETGQISNFNFFVLPVENDWVEAFYDGTKWRLTGGGQVPWKGPGGQHRTPDSTYLWNKAYNIHEGDRGAVIRVVTGDSDGPYPSGAVQAILPSNSMIRQQRSQDYASTWRVGVMLARNPPTRYVWVVSPDSTVSGQAGFTIDIPDRIYWFDFDSAQWIVEA